MQRRPQPHQADNRPSEEEERIKENNDVKVSSYINYKAKICISLYHHSIIYMELT